MNKQIGHKSEEDFVQIFPDFKLTSNMKLQNEDVDAVHKVTGKTISIKCQDMALKTGNFQFETVLADTVNKVTMDGNFYKCTADYYAIKAGDEWFLFKSDELHQFVVNGNWHGRWLSEKVHAINVAQKRKFDQAYSLLVPVVELRKIAIVVKV